MAFTAVSLFLVSCAISVAVAPDKVLALNHAALLLGGLFAAWVLALVARAIARRPVLGIAGTFSAWLAALLCIHVALTRYASSLIPWAAGDSVNDNVLATGLVILIPLGLGGLGYWLVSSSVSRTLFGLLTAGCILFAVAGLILTNSRAGMLALVVGALIGVWIAVRGHPRSPRAARQALDVLAVAVPLGLAGLVLLTLLLPAFTPGPLGATVVAGSSGTRAALWRDGLSLARDYQFTGVGFGATMMALSTYVYLLHVGVVGHVHNFLLELTIEQGLLGLVGYSFVLLSGGTALVQAYRQHSVPRWMVGAVAASLIGMLVHGLFDGGAYVSRLAPLIFLPLGFAWGAAPAAPPLRTLSPGQLGGRGMAVLAPLLVMLLLLARPGARGAMQANLGAVEQSARELALYEWPTWGIQDQLRRSAAVDLQGAIARYAGALSYDVDNVTAYRRLGQIALSLGDLAAAERYLTEAYLRAPEERATRLMLGEALALQGQPQRAAELWRTVDTTKGELAAREWWVRQVATPEQQASFAAAQLLR
jgi:O-antigen ligase